MNNEALGTVQHFLRLYELQRETLNRRREIEWKVCISFWTAIIVGTGFLIQKAQIDSDCFWFYLILFAVFSLLWLGTMFHSNERDHYWIDVYKSHIHETLGTPFDKVRPRPKWFTCLTSPWWISQVSITALLLFASYYLLSTNAILRYLPSS